ncbi:hypothetical protein BGZ73_006703 [Actinomortierella ambigua]|nr:hypothetical protein BGZ73_006703 [Actinomortierella ambigua]
MEKPRAHLVPGPTNVPTLLQERYATTYYGSGDLYEECIAAYERCGSRLAKLVNLPPEKGSVVIMSGEGMVGLWGGLKSVIPWPFDANGQPVADAKFKVLCVGNGVYGDGMYDMVKSLRYPNVEVELITSPWDAPIQVDKAVAKIHEWKPDLVTAVHCDTPTGALNSEAVKAFGKATAEIGALYYVDVVSAAGACPVDFADWNIDIGLLGTQKVFSCEPSLAMITVSNKAWKQIEKVAYTGYDALLPFKTAKGLGTQFPYTPLWSALDALDIQLKSMYGENNEKAESVYERHAEAAAHCREAVKKMGLKLWWSDELEWMNSPTVTSIRVPENTTWRELDAKLRARGVVCGGSYGETTNALFRIGHMGTQTDRAALDYALSTLEDVLKHL